ncbi:SDR family oxidoreductase [Flavobacterium sp. j3]|uniref:SDR family oxidoreductase n=1 Tax=Flavobacterium aureirubrum TaxID=3133147 RepID=A0ABU9NB80_9FLAO
MDLKLDNKKVFISGSTNGIGLAIAKTFAKENALVYINGRTQDSVDNAIEKIKNEVNQANVIGIVADLSKPDGINTVKNQIKEVEILINNLGIYEPRSFFEITTEDWIRIFNINVLTGIKLTQHLLPAMLDKNWGRVLFISSESGLQIPSEMIHYGMTKTAQIAIANGLAQLTKGTGVTVNSILPGPTYSAGVQQFIQDLAIANNQTTQEVEKEFFNETRPLSLLQRFINTEEVASIAVYLSSPLAAATNGASVRVDGGILKSI